MSGEIRKISLCLPAYNNGEDVRRALASIASQTFRDFETVVSDDSDTDGVEREVQAFRQENQDIPVTYVRNDLAFSGSRQVLLDPEGESLSHLEADAPKERAASDEFLTALSKDWRHLFLGNEIGAPSAVIFRRSTGARFDEKSGWASDMYLYADLLKDNPHFACTREPLISIGMHRGQYTESFAEKDERIYADYRYFYEKYQLRDSKECRDYFLSHFVVKYHKPWKEAKALGFTRQEYERQKGAERLETLSSFLRARFGKA